MKQLVVLVHGIRTFGAWQERLEELLYKEAHDRDLTVACYKYGYFSFVAFVVPFLRWLEVRKFRKWLLSEILRSNWDRIDIVAHSFGTHIIAWALHGTNRESRLQINTIILAGSVLRSNFPWSDLIGHGVRRLVNDCGTKDVVLVLSHFGALLMGMAGRNGFEGGTGKSFRNRFFEYGHSDYFQKDGKPDDLHMRRYWLPLLLTDAEAELVDARKPTAFNGIKTTLINNAEPIKIFMYAAPVVASVLWIQSIRGEVAIQRTRAVERLTAGVQTANALILNAHQYRRKAGVPEHVAVELLKQARVLVEELAKTDNATPEMLERQGLVLTELSSALRSQGDADGAVTAANAALSVFGKMSSTQGANVSGRIGRVVSYDRLGDALFDSCDRKGAIKSYMNGLKILDIPNKPSNGTDTHNLAVLKGKVGDMLRVDGRNEAALVLFREAEALRHQLLRKDPNRADWRREFSVVSGKIAEVLVAMGKSEDATPFIERSLQIAKELSSQDSDRVDWRQDHAIASQDAANWLRIQNDRKAAIILLATSAKISKDLATSDAKRVPWQRDWMTSLVLQADLLMEERKASGALPLYQEALPIAATAANRKPICIYRQRDLAVIYQKIGEAFQAQGDLASALGSYESSLKIRKVLARDRTAPASWERELAQNYIRVCNNLVDRGLPKEALLMARDQETLLRQTQIGEHPKKALAQAIGNVAWYALLAEAWVTAEDAAQEAIKIAPDLDWLYANLAHARMFSGNTDGARSEYLLKTRDSDEWRKSILKDFQVFRDRGLSRPLMEEISQKFGKG